MQSNVAGFNLHRNPWNLAVEFRHCEEQGDEAIQQASEAVLDCFASLAMTGS